MTQDNCDCSLDTDVRGRCWEGDDTFDACKVKDDTIMFQFKNDYDLMHTDEITQLRWLLDKGCSMDAICEYFRSVNFPLESLSDSSVA